MMINDIEDDVEIRHWNECRMISQYDAELAIYKSGIAEIKQQIAALKRSTPMISEYLHGYIMALSAVEGMIDEMEVKINELSSTEET